VHSGRGDDSVNLTDLDSAAISRFERIVVVLLQWLLILLIAIALLELGALILPRDRGCARRGSLQSAAENGLEFRAATLMLALTAGYFLIKRASKSARLASPDSDHSALP
jgi:hypothetical protein